MGRLGLGLGLVLVLRQGLGLALGLQLRIGIGFRRNHSWSSTFTPRRNHSLCLSVMLSIRPSYGCEPKLIRMLPVINAINMLVGSMKLLLICRHI